MTITTFSQDVSAFFAAGTSLGAYPASNWPVEKRPPAPGVAPVGSATATATSASSGVVSFTGLADSTEYYISDSAGTRYVRITTYPSSTLARSSDVATETSRATAAEATKPTLDANGKVPWTRLAGQTFVVTDAAYGADATGATDSYAAIQAALNAAAAVTAAGYGSSLGATVLLPPGRYAISNTLTVADRVTLLGAGSRVSSIVPWSTFAGTCFVRNADQSGSQEWANMAGFSISGNYIAQANAGSATTVNQATSTPAPTTPFTLIVAATTGFAAAGTLLVGTQRVIYTGKTATSFTGCNVISASGTAIANGAAVTAVTTNNVQGVQIINLYANSFVRDIVVNQTSGEGLYVGGNTNCVDFNNLWINQSNRDVVLISGQPSANRFSKITAQYAGQNGTSGTFAEFHVLGQSLNTGAFFQGSISVEQLFMEKNVASSPACWLENIGNIEVDTVRLQGGSNYTGQVCVQLDSAHASPLTADGLHSSPVLLRNLFASQVTAGRKVLVDNVRSFDSGTGAIGVAPNVINRYDTEDSSPGTVRTWAANTFYWAGSLVVNGKNVYSAKATFISSSSFSAANWDKLTDREHALLIGTLTTLRESASHRQAWGTALATTSGTQIGATVPVLAGESYDDVFFTTSTTPATFGSNNDGHWYVAVYDDSGNLVTQTADQGVAAIAASTNFRIALNATVTPTTDALYTVVLMVYLGTGGSPVAPTLKSSGGISSSPFITGMPKTGLTANSSQTTGVAFGSLGTTTATSSMPYFALYK